MVKFGSLLPIPAAQPSSLIKVALRTENAGFDSVWVADHLLMIPTGIVPEAFSLLASIATTTQKVDLGTCVSDPHRRHPAVFAQIAATIDQISNGRMIIGLGCGEAMNIEPFGIPWNKPVARMKEFVEIVRKLWKEENITYNGKFWKMNGAFLQIKPKREVPIYLGANGPLTRKLAGIMADGWLPFPQSPELYKKHLKEIKSAARKVGRELDNFETCIYIYTAVSKDYNEALEQLKKIKPIIAFFPKILEEAGYSVDKRFDKNLYSKILVNEEGMKKFEEFGRQVPDEVVEQFSIVGRVEDCLNKIEEFVKAGVKHFVLINMGPDPKYVMDIYSKKIIPSFKEL
ncbi:hypothetical protein DRO97_07800 [Archaeoglobales archaeon]|nr:MAG: hypothetical protein DRO97_07800 [Archaeoglobales archaeon]